MGVSMGATRKSMQARGFFSDTIIWVSYGRQEDKFFHFVRIWEVEEKTIRKKEEGSR